MTTTSLPPSPAPYDRDADNLRVLSICWYVIAALQALLGGCGCIYVGFGLIVALTGAAASEPGRPAEAAPAAGMGLMFSCFGLFFMALVWTFAFLNFKVGQSLVRRKNLTLCYIMAAIACLSIPIGTLLGVFTFIVLSRPSVKVSFR